MTTLLHFLSIFLNDPNCIKQHKAFECQCPEGFTGSFCEQREALTHLLYALKKQTYLFDGNGLFLGNTESIVDANVQIHGSCSTLLNGHAMIFGGGNDTRQVVSKWCIYHLH